ncbi:hypothetical protein Ms3S1_35720 [Methylosinus sp. 3S-1]
MASVTEWDKGGSDVGAAREGAPGAGGEWFTPEAEGIQMAASPPAHSRETAGSVFAAIG